MACRIINQSSQVTLRPWAWEEWEHVGEAEQSVEFYINMTDVLLTRWWGKKMVLILKFDSEED